ncbi:MAG: hypothetical protein ACLFVW_02640 [Phycisphaerae bacterium]
MDTLTKIFVVVLVVLVLVFCPIAVNLLTVPENYREQLERAQQRNNVLEATARTAKLSEEAVLSRAEDYKAQLERVRTSSEERVSELQSELDEERRHRAELQRSYNTAAAELKGINTSLDATVQLRRQLSEQLESTRDEANQLRREKMELSDALRDAEARADRLTDQIRLLRERLAASEERVSQLEERLASTGAEDEPRTRTAASVDLTAEVTTIDENIVGINAGSAQGVSKGMRMIIYRDAELVAQVDIQEVDMSSAAGVITDRQLDPKPGDKVTTTLE